MKATISINIPEDADAKKQRLEQKREEKRERARLKAIGESLVDRHKFYLNVSNMSFGRITRYNIKDLRLELWFECVEVKNIRRSVDDFWHTRTLSVYDHWSCLKLSDMEKLIEVKDADACVNTVNTLLGRFADEYEELVKSFELKQNNYEQND